jgi:pimeloyl-ACP methyl ester carboxylesterase
MGYAELLLSHGYDVLAPDARAQGDSGGTFPTYGIKEANDVHRWFDFLQVQVSRLSVKWRSEVLR